jgi:ribosomal protein S25
MPDPVPEAHGRHVDDRREGEQAVMVFNVDQEQLIHAADLVTSTQLASQQMLQRRLRVSAALAFRLMSALEEWGIIAKAEGQSLAVVLVTHEQLPEAVSRIRRGIDATTDLPDFQDPQRVVPALVPGVHAWGWFGTLVCCLWCGRVRNPTSDERPCPGQRGKVELR